MLTIEYSKKANNQLDNIVSNSRVYDQFGHFTQQYRNWNEEFYRYVNKNAISQQQLSNQGWCEIGSIAVLEYQCYHIIDTIIFEILEFHFTILPYDTSKQPNIQQTTPIHPNNINHPFTLPKNTRFLNGVYYNGFRVGYCNRKYAIVDSKGLPFVEKWFDKRPRFFKKPFGRYNVMAHVSCNGKMYAVTTNGQMIPMRQSWNDYYLNEQIRAILKQILVENKKFYLTESNNPTKIRLNEQELVAVIREIVLRLVA